MKKLSFVLSLSILVMVSPLSISFVEEAGKDTIDTEDNAKYLDVLTQDEKTLLYTEVILKIVKDIINGQYKIRREIAELKVAIEILDHTVAKEKEVKNLQKQITELQAEIQKLNQYISKQQIDN